MADYEPIPETPHPPSASSASTAFNVAGAFFSTYFGASNIILEELDADPALLAALPGADLGVTVFLGLTSAVVAQKLSSNGLSSLATSVSAYATGKAVEGFFLQNSEDIGLGIIELSLDSPGGKVAALVATVLSAFGVSQFGVKVFNAAEQKGAQDADQLANQLSSSASLYASGATGIVDQVKSVTQAFIGAVGTIAGNIENQLSTYIQNLSTSLVSKANQALQNFDNSLGVTEQPIGDMVVSYRISSRPFGLYSQNRNLTS